MTSADTSARRAAIEALYRPRLQRRRIIGGLFLGVCVAGTLFAILMLGLLLFEVGREGTRFLSIDFLQRFPSRFPEQAGFKAALYGSLWLMGLTALMTFPLGVGAAIYLEEYAPRGWLPRLIQLNISNLAGVPSIVFGLLGLELFVRGNIGFSEGILGFHGFGRSVLAGSMTLTLVILPVVIVAAQEAIRAVPPSIREGSYGVGATRWQTIWNHVLPQAFPGIMTGMILALSRAIGETAPLITIGALTFVAFTPSGPLDSFTAMPIQIFNWTSRPQDDFRAVAASGIIVLLAVLLTMNAIAVFLRYKTGHRTSR